MKKENLGNTQVAVSELCLGAMYLGTRNDEESSYRLLDQYLDAGGSFIDTANIYSSWVAGFRGGESEALLGRWMKGRRNRAGLFLASKVGFEYAEATRGLRSTQIAEECEKSLRRLGVDTIDLYYAHVDDRKTPLEETLLAFDKLVRAGKVRFLGASNYVAWRLEEARAISKQHGLPEFCCIQQRYTFARPKPGASFAPQTSANDDLLDYCRSRPITMLAYSPLLSGAYTRLDRPMPAQYVSPDTEARRAVLAEVARELSATPNQVILAWMLGSSPKVLPVVGASTSDQLAENLAAAKLTLGHEHLARLSAASA